MNLSDTKYGNEKKYNHYVPVFLQKMFSDNKKSVSMYIKSKDIYVENSPIRRNARSEYLYGKSGELEEWFCKYEEPASKIIKNICLKESLPLKQNLKEFLYSFFTVSEARTKAIGEDMTNSYNKAVKTAVKYAIAAKCSDVNDFTPEDIENIKISIDIPNLSLLREALEVARHIKDLKMILMINKTNTSFVLSDCPVAKYNPYLIDCININGYGWYQKGILAFTPISKDYALGLIDTSIYKIKSLRFGKIFINSEEQINELNKLFALQAEEFIFLAKDLTEDYVKSLLSEESETKAFNLEQLMITNLSIKSIKNKINFSFLKMKVKPLKGHYHNKSDYYRKSTIPLLYNSKEEYKKDKKVDYNKFFENIEKIIKN